MQKQIFLITGAPGSGKTTISKKLINKNINHYSIGEMYRLLARDKSKLSKTIKIYINKGKVVPLRIAKKVIKSFLEKEDKKIIIDGFPRNMEQAKMFSDILSDNYRLIKVIEILIDPSVAKKRIVQRNRGVDDNPNLYSSRLEVFNKEIQQIREYYKIQNLYTTINGNLPLKYVEKEIKNLIKD